MAIEVAFVKKSLADQVADNLRELIINGEFSGESNFPSSRQLAQRYAISHNVMLKVLHKLNDEELICMNSKREGYKLKSSN